MGTATAVKITHCQQAKGGRATPGQDPCNAWLGAFVGDCIRAGKDVTINHFVVKTCLKSKSKMCIDI